MGSCDWRGCVAGLHHENILRYSSVKKKICDFASVS